MRRAVERVRTLKRAIGIRARWKRCGLLGPVRLTMRIDRTTDAGQGTMILLGFGGLCWDANTCWVDPTSSFRYFVEGDTGHALLAAPAAASQNGVMLLPWLGQLLADDPGWTSVEP